MTNQHTLLHHTLEHATRRFPDRIALKWRSHSATYAQLSQAVELLGQYLLNLGLARLDRVAIYLPKQLETVCSFFACSRVGLIFVPINPLLKRDQVAHILRDSGAKLLITGSTRLKSLLPILEQCPDLQTVLLSDYQDAMETSRVTIDAWPNEVKSVGLAHTVIDIDPVAIFYTSGSTGLAKGVLLSHRNMLCGAVSVTEYLRNHGDDKILALLPFSFDYGFNQLSSAMLVGAELVMMDYLLPQDAINLLERERITGLAAVPSLWIQLSRFEFSDSIKHHLRYITNSGGAMPISCLQALRKALPQTQIYLMYGLTEAFRSTYLDPALVDQFPNSIGKAIPNAEILVLREDGNECDIDEPGELVHRGGLVALGYWNDPALSAQRFRQLPPQYNRGPLPETAVWSGDTVKKDRHGLLYFIGRRDEMIKTSGYRVSPGEIEQLLHAEFPRHEFAAFAINHPDLGQAIVLAVVGDGDIRDQLKSRLSELLPNYMQPRHIVQLARLPLNSNNKVDRKQLGRQFQYLHPENDK